MKVNVNFIANKSTGISQAEVSSVSTDARPPLGTGTIGGEVGK